jgi:hypothetical protein
MWKSCQQNKVACQEMSSQTYAAKALIYGNLLSAIKILFKWCLNFPDYLIVLNHQAL